MNDKEKLWVKIGEIKELQEKLDKCRTEVYDQKLKLESIARWINMFGESNQTVCIERIQEHVKDYN